MIKILSLAIISLLSLSVYANSPQKINTALQNGNSTELAEVFNNSIELTMPNTSGVYAKEQARLVIDNFFKANSPSKCTLSHETSGASSSMLVYELVTKNGTFRVSLVVNISGGGFVINELKIQ